jgi:DNA-binding MarR family transcriptional regulator
VEIFNLNFEMSAPSPADLPRRLAAALRRLQVLTDASGRRAADGAGVSTRQMLILGCVVKQPGQRVGELARRLEVTPGTVSVALDALEEKGLVRRVADPDEHRAVLIHATPKGARMGGDLDGWADDSLGPLVDELGVKDGGATLVALITTLGAAADRGLIDPVRMCSRCRYFQPFGARTSRGRTPQRPHRCDLLEKDIGPAELQVDCPEFEEADRDERGRRPSLFPST